MKIGIFDSGLGGLVTMRGIVKRLPGYDYVYLGDTKRVPYGNRSQETIYEFTEAAVKFLFDRGCGLVIIACNTASTEALRRIQRNFLPKAAPGRRVLGVIIPAAEAAAETGARRIGLIGTIATVHSDAYVREIKKLRPEAKLTQVAAPLLAPMIENGGTGYLEPILKDYLRPLAKAETLILGCTHYPIAKGLIRRLVGKKVKVICQDEVVPEKLADYLRRRPEIEKKLSRRGSKTFYATDITETLKKLSKNWFGKNIKLELADLD